MADTTAHGTGIEWTHVPGYTGETWNPVRGCTKISPGCKHCYAETFAERWRGVVMPDGKPHAYHQGFDLRLVPEKLDEPLRASKPRAYFVNSMSDLHQDGVPHEFIRMVYAVMHETTQHLHMVLTKRPENMLTSIARMFGEMAPVTLPSGRHLPRPFDGEVPACVLFPRTLPLEHHRNVWMGVSVEDRKYGLPRVDILRQVPAAVRFLSVEPLLEDLGPMDLSGIHWVIIGGESGQGARPFDVDWAERIVIQCKEQGVPVFLKQLGAAPIQVFGGLVPIRLNLKSKKGSDEAEWPSHLRGLKQFPQIVRAA